MASTVRMGTIAPSGTRMWATTPDAVDSSSVAILAVSSSTRGSPSWTGSPSCFSHLTMVASCISMPHWGKTISWAIGVSFLLPLPPVYLR